MSLWGDTESEVDDFRCADVDLDGWQDLVVTVTRRWSGGYAQDTRLELWLNRGDLTFQDVTAANLPQTASGEGFIKRLQVADLNGDRWPDIIASWISGGPSRLYFATGDGRYSEFRFPSYPGTTYLADDLTGDGKVDLVRLTGRLGGDIALLRQD
jgi:hypothetical protein